MEGFYRILDKVLGAILIVLVVLMTLSISLEMFNREVLQHILLWLFGSSPAWITELSSPVNTASQTLLVWLGILGSALALKERAHLGVDALVRLYSKRGKIIIEYFSIILVMLFSVAVFMVGGWMVCQRSIQGGWTMPGFPDWNRAWFYSVLPITGTLILIYSVWLLRHPRPAGSHEVSEEKREES